MPEKQLFKFQFEGRKGQFDVGWQQASWYDYKNVHVPIDHLDGSPTHWIFWEAEGKSYYADDQPWNEFKSPEQIYRWADFLPANEHATLLNDVGQGYNWFHGNAPFHSRLARPVYLKKGKVELAFEFFADWYKWENGKRSIHEVGDPNHARVEMNIAPTDLSEVPNWSSMGDGEIRGMHDRLHGFVNQLPGSHDDWIVVRPTVGASSFTKTIDVPEDGVYMAVFGAMAVWAVPGGSGRNGLWGHLLGASQVEESAGTPPVDRVDPTTTTRPAEPVTVGSAAAATGEVSQTEEIPVSSVAGLPRVQYRRVFQLVHSSVSDAAAVEIFRNGRSQGKTTGFSPDDAGIGALDEKVVEVYGWPGVEHADLVDFFEKYYPGTELFFHAV